MTQLRQGEIASGFWIVPTQFIPFKIRDIRRRHYLHSVGHRAPIENELHICIHLTTFRGM